jgi:uncharacterized protein (TIGR03086 family)
VAHAVTNLRCLRDSIDGGDFFTGFGQAVDGDILEAWNDARSRVSTTLDAAADVDTAVVGGNQVPLGMIVDGLTRDLVIHTWDLARAVGGDEQLPEDLVTVATRSMADIEPDQRVPGLYGQELDVPAGADAQARLLALSGRTA